MAIPTPIDEFQVYMQWPEAEILKALDEFKHGENGMYNGGDADNLTAGILCMDFLTRASEMSDTTQMLVEAAVQEAEMRITLMARHELERLTEAEQRERAIRLVTQLHRSFSHLQRQLKERIGPEWVQDHLEKRWQRRNNLTTVTLDDDDDEETEY